MSKLLRFKSFKGELSKDTTLRVPTLWGKYAANWFKEGERCLVFTDRHSITLGLLGRMPLIEVDGQEVLESFAEDPGFFEQFEKIEYDNRLLIPWSAFRTWLLEKYPSTEQPSDKRCPGIK